MMFMFLFFQAEDGIRDLTVTGVQTCALPICLLLRRRVGFSHGRILTFATWKPKSETAKLPKRGSAGAFSKTLSCPIGPRKSWAAHVRFSQLPKARIDEDEVCPRPGRNSTLARWPRFAVGC